MIAKRICVIGVGNWGKNHLRTLFKLGALAGIVESDSSSRILISKEYPKL